MECPACGMSDTLVPVQKDHVVKYRIRKFRKIIYGQRCMHCGESFMNPLDHRYDEELDAFMVRVNKETEEYTCAGCPDEPNCPYRWDLYNKNGDCLCQK